MPDLSGFDAGQRDAYATVMDVLKQYGLESLAGFVFTSMANSLSEAEILQGIRKTPEFQARFPAIAEREKAGLPALSPGEYVQYEQQATQLMRAAGLPKGFYDTPSDFTQFLSGDVSVAELQDRIQMGQQAMYEAPPEARAALKQQYNLSDGDITAYFLDPGKADPLLKQQWTAAQINGAAARTGFGMGSTAEAERLAKLGVTVSQAEQGYGQLVAGKELYGNLPGEHGDTIDRATQVGAALGGDAAAKQRIARKSQSRTAEFSGGGQVATTSNGATGLSDTSRR
jgi:hypothetical protein